MDGCTRPRLARGVCGTHYAQWRRAGGTEVRVLQRPARGVCSADGCTSPHSSHGYCNKHSKRWLRTGNLGLRRPRGVCTVDDCTEREKARGYCGKHLARLLRHGDVHMVMSPRDGALRGPAHPLWKDEPGYQSAHGRVWRARGPASDYPCVDCGRRAAHWSYSNQDPNELICDRTGLRYSTDPSHYSSRCQPCHHAFDRQAAAQTI